MFPRSRGFGFGNIAGAIRHILRKKKKGGGKLQERVKSNCAEIVEKFAGASIDYPMYIYFSRLHGYTADLPP